MGKYKKKGNPRGPVDFPPRSLSKILFKKCRDSIKHVATLAKIQSTKEASHHLALTDNCQSFYSHIIRKYKGSLLLPSLIEL